MIKTAAVIGHPVSHSLSPDLFSFLAKELGVELQYKAIDVQPENLAAFVREQKSDASRVGFNVTIPHKEKLFDLLDIVTKEARTVGAVNVIEIKNGKWTGHNTDVLGLQDSFQLNGVDLDMATVIILGAGGAARAAAFASAVEGAARVVICNRSLEKAAAIVNEFNRVFSNTEFVIANEQHDFSKENAKLVIQATPMGMSGVQSDSIEIFERILSGPFTFAFDLVYRPEETEFLKLAKAQGFQTISGLSMLIGQALATWEIWFSPLQDKEKLFQSLTVFLRKKLEPIA